MDRLSLHEVEGKQSGHNVCILKQNSILWHGELTNKLSLITLPFLLHNQSAAYNMWLVQTNGRGLARNMTHMEYYFESSRIKIDSDIILSKKCWKLLNIRLLKLLRVAQFKNFVWNRAVQLQGYKNCVWCVSETRGSK